MSGFQPNSHLSPILEARSFSQHEEQQDLMPKFDLPNLAGPSGLWIPPKAFFLLPPTLQGNRWSPSQGAREVGAWEKFTVDSRPSPTFTCTRVAD